MERQSRLCKVCEKSVCDSERASQSPICETSAQLTVNDRVCMFMEMYLFAGNISAYSQRHTHTKT